MMERHVELSLISTISVAGPEQVHKLVPAIGRVIEFAPRESDEIGILRNIDAPIGGIENRAVIDPDVAGIVQPHSVLARPDDRKVSHDDSAAREKVQTSANQRRSGAETNYSFVRADMRVHGRNCQRA